MALSDSEHTLLVNTCENMNIAAATCRQVLDMLRSLGASGVVDIAAHNNAATVHNSATNLVHCNSGRAFYGSPSTLPIAGSMYPVELRQDDNTLSGVLLSNSTLGSGANKIPGVRTYRVFTDSNGDLINSDAINSAVGKEIFQITASGGSLINGTGAFKTASMLFRAGDCTSDDRKTTSILFQISNGSSYKNSAEINQHGICPFGANTGSTLGISTARWSTIYLDTSPNVSSDSRLKKNVQELDDQSVEFIKNLHPVQYQYNINGTQVLEADESGEPVSTIETPGIRKHWGFISQDVKSAMATAGIEDAAVWCLADKDNPDSMQSLRYEELIAPLVKAVQVLVAKVEALEAR